MKNVERDDDLHLHMIGILSDKTIHFLSHDINSCYARKETKDGKNRLGRRSKVKPGDPISIE